MPERVTQVASDLFVTSGLEEAFDKIVEVASEIWNPSPAGQDPRARGVREALAGERGGPRRT